jgi:prepilin-type processing-associated H-X9-DG protein
MGMGCTRVVERVCAAVGLLQEASPQFATNASVARGGVLWALPALPGFYGLTQVFVLLAAMALARVRTMEQLRYQPAGEWDKLLGLDRIPEVRTLRGKVKVLAQPEAVSEWGKRPAQEWMAEDPEAAGFLYVDGHVRPYHGIQTQLPRRYVARQRLCLRGMTDYWVNDQQGRPFFVISTALIPGLLATLKQNIVPRLLAEVTGQPSGELARHPYRCRFTLIYDREGLQPGVLSKDVGSADRVPDLSQIPQRGLAGGGIYRAGGALGAWRIGAHATGGTGHAAGQRSLGAGDSEANRAGASSLDPEHGL